MLRVVCLSSCVDLAGVNHCSGLREGGRCCEEILEEEESEEIGKKEGNGKKER